MENQHIVIGAFGPRAALVGLLWAALVASSGCSFTGTERVHCQRFSFEGEPTRRISLRGGGQLQLERSERAEFEVDVVVRYRGRRPPTAQAEIIGDTLQLDLDCHPSLPTCEGEFVVRWPQPEALETTLSAKE